MMTEGEKFTFKLMAKYDYLVINYAKKLYNIHRISMDADDVRQELRIILQNVIVTYSLAYQDYKNGLRDKPTPLPIYIMASFKNFTTKIVQRMSAEGCENISYGDLPYDIGEVERNPFAEREQLIDIPFNPFRGLKGKQLLFYRQFLKEGGQGMTKESVEQIAQRWKLSLKKAREIINHQKKVVLEQINDSKQP